MRRGEQKEAEKNRVGVGREKERERGEWARGAGSEPSCEWQRRRSQGSECKMGASGRQAVGVQV